MQHQVTQIQVVSVKSSCSSSPFSTFSSLDCLSFYRQSHKSFFGKSDLFFVCLLKPRSFDIQKQDIEIAEAQVFSGIQRNDIGLFP